MTTRLETGTASGPRPVRALCGMPPCAKGGNNGATAGHFWRSALPLGETLGHEIAEKRNPEDFRDVKLGLRPSDVGLRDFRFLTEKP